MAGEVKWDESVGKKPMNEAQKSLIAYGYTIEASIKTSFKKGTGAIYARPRQTSTFGKTRAVTIWKRWGGKNVTEKDYIKHQASAPGEPPAVDTGRLRASISTNWSGSGMDKGRVDAQALPDDGIGEPKGDKFTVVVGTNVDYACLDAESNILTKKGLKRISKIEVGDLVLTQTGEYHPVLKVFSRPMSEVTGMVTLKVKYRKGRIHILNCTEEHKILVHRDGRNKWVRAGDLLLSDKLFTRIKISHHAGISIHRPLLLKKCLYCKNIIEFTTDFGAGYKNRKFCSVSCRAKYWREYGNPHIGFKYTEESRKKMSEKARFRFENYPESHPNRIMAKKGFCSSTEKKVKKWLDERNIFYLPQYKIGKRFVDFYIPDENMIIESNGDCWHQKQVDDIERDKELLKCFPGGKILHIHFCEREVIPRLNPNPLPGVYYVSCNPDTGSFANPEIFKNVEILEIKKWKYERGKNRGEKDAKLRKVFDICVDTIHSYYANGILVSNSALEFGTVKMKPRPFMRPALLKARKFSPVLKS